MKNFLILFPILTFLIILIRMEASMPWREGERLFTFKKEDKYKEWSNQEKKEHRKKDYKIMLIFWLILNIVVFICYLSVEPFRLRVSGERQYATEMRDKINGM